MADENKPAGPISSSRLASENAYRKRKGLPPLTMEEYAAQVSGGAPPAAAPAAPAAAAPETPAAAAPPAAAPAAGGAPGTLTVGGKPMSSSKLASENAYRKKKGLPPLVPDQAAEAPAPAAAATPATPAAARPAAPAPKIPAAAGSIAGSGPATRYVGTPAVGTSKAASAGGVAAIGPSDTPVDQRRRRLVWITVVAFLTTWLLAFFRFFLPRTIFEPSTVFKIGTPSDYGFGVDTKWQQQYRIWVTRTPGKLFVIYARCTHLGCTPDWKEGESKFKCPCHGSGFDNEGINFEGPAPRPLDRAHVELDATGQIVVDVSRLKKWPKGQRSEFDDDGAFIGV